MKNKSLFFLIFFAFLPFILLSQEVQEDPLPFQPYMKIIVNKDGLKGVKDSRNGRMVVPQKYLRIAQAQADCWKLYTMKEEYGYPYCQVTDTTGRLFFESAFYSNFEKKGDYFIGTLLTGKEKQLLSLKGEPLCLSSREVAEIKRNKLFIYRDGNDLCIVINEKGEKITSLRFEDIDFLDEPNNYWAKVETKIDDNTVYYLADISSDIPVFYNDTIYEEIYPEGDKPIVYLSLKKNGLFALADILQPKKINFLTDFKYKKLYPIGKNKFAAMRKGDVGTGVINEKEEIIVPFEYRFFKEMYGNFVGVDSLHNETFFSEKGEKISFNTDYSFQQSFGFYDSLLIVKDKNTMLYSVLDRKGATVIPSRFATINRLYYCNTLDDCKPKTYWKTLLNDQYGINDTDGKEILAPAFEEINIFHEKCFAIKKNNRWGVANTKGEVIVPCEYENIFTNWQKNDTIFCVRKNDLWGFVNDKNKVVFPFIYHKINSFYPDISDKRPKAQVMIDTAEYEIFLDSGEKRLKNTYTKEQAIRVDFKHNYNKLDYFYHSEMYVVKNDKLLEGIVDTVGRVIVPCMYDLIDAQNRGSLSEWIVEKNDQKGVLLHSGKMLIPCEYQQVYLSENKKYWITQKNAIQMDIFDREGKNIIKNALFEDVPIDNINNYLYIYTHVSAQQNSIYDVQNQRFLTINTPYESVSPIKNSPNKNWVILNHKNKAGIYDLEKQTFVLQPKYFFLRDDFGANRLSFAILDKETDELKYGFLDEKGNEVIPAIYDAVTKDFQPDSQLAVVSIGKKILVINTNGEVVRTN